MCGINGFNFQNDELARRMNAATRHRGPDATGVASFSGCTLGHDRLAIIDLSPGGAQPMRSRDGRFTIAFNGEIYNYRELKAALSGAYEFRSQSDTEVILALYAKKGTQAFADLNGIYAFAIWDEREKTLVLARDPAGVKPLYYAWDGKKLIFSSEAKGLLEAGVAPKLDREALSFYLLLGYVPSPLSLFAGVRKLLPNAWLKLKDGKLETGVCRPMKPQAWQGSREEAVAEIRRTAEAAVDRQMISDRPLGVFLSGGIDSTALAALCVKRSSEPLRTYTTRFDVGVQQERFNADADLAKETAKRLGARHVELLVGPKETMAAIPELAWHLDEPNGNATASAMYFLSKAASNDVAVLLGGDGPDELFGGYDRYRAARLIGYARKCPLVLRELCAKALAAAGKEKHAGKLRIKDDADLHLSLWLEKDASTTDLYPEGVLDRGAVHDFFLASFYAGRGDFENRMMEADRKSWLTDESLQRSDRMTAASGVEGRVPWLDLELVELAMRLPSDWKIRRPFTADLQGKRVWTEAVRDLVPDELVNREKTGWYAPMSKWLRDPQVYAEVRERLAALPPELVNRPAAQRLLDAHREAKGYYVTAIWQLVMLQAWIERFNVVI